MTDLTHAASAPTLITLGSTRLYQGDALSVLATLPDNSVDAICTDPPYGLSKEPDIAEVLTHWLAGDDYTHTGKGFMGNTWDSFVPGPSIWREAYRVLKPGGYAAVFASTRTYDLMVTSLRLAGFQVVDTLMWMNSQGFPKSLNISRALEKAGHLDEAAKFDGYGNALKPAHEPIALVRKPLEGRYIDNVLAHGTGVLNIDACRIKNTGTDPAAANRDGEASAERRYTANGGTNFAATPGPRGGAPEGRYPSNVLFSHDPTCVRVGEVSVKAPVINRFTDGAKPFGGGAGHPYESVPTGDADGNEALSVYACVLGCPVRELDNQSGIRTSGKPGTYRGTPNRSAAYGAESRKAGEAMTGYGDSGGASRFFPTFGYVKKATQKERPTVYVPTTDCVKAGHYPDPHDPATRWDAAASPVETVCPTCAEPWVAYQHPTVKPPPIMAWLLNLLTPTGGVALDLFAGTGTTGEAAQNTGHDVILIERDPAHVAMIANRLTVTEPAPSEDDHPSLFD
jgi:DNA modification methylase